jgi:SAM-dependent methyltransferase
MIMAVYNEFAPFYFQGPYRDFSLHILASFGPLQERYNLPREGAMLDIACGTGDFAIGMAELGWRVTGLDQSDAMLAFARQSAREKGIHVVWRQDDMRSFNLANQFDLATCWYDSLNYNLTLEDLRRTFRSAFRAIRPGGYFVFDMNTIYQLAVGWQQNPFYLQQDTKNFVEIHRTSFDEQKQIASLHVTGFIKKGQHWVRMDETHRERGYPIDDIITCLEAAGFAVIDAISNLQVYSKPKSNSKRIWFVSQRPIEPTE